MASRARRWLCLWVYAALATWLIAPVAQAADHRVERLESPPPGEGVSAAILDLVAPQGYRVVRGTSRVVFEFWPAKQWTLQSEFTPSGAVLYPFEFGQFVGIAQFPRKGGDFRGQEIDPGVYTVRYAQQPVDGNHVGTSKTRDFWLLLPIADDIDPKPLEKAPLFKLSAQASGTTHPAMLCLLPVSGEAATGAAESLPAMLHHADADWWALKFANPAASGDQTSELVVEVVVVGKAKE